MSDDVSRDPAARGSRSILDAVVSSFAGAGVPDGLDSWSPTELGVFARLREGFMAAGAEQARRMLSPDSWLQLGVAFADAAQARRFQSTAMLRKAVEAWLAEGLIDSFFFMNKPPGMRLRFSVPGGDERMEDRIVSLLEGARGEGLLEWYEFGIYDQETHQFGGPAGIDIFHRFSTCDSLAILRFRELEAEAATTIDRSVLSILAMNDLVARVAEDSWEQWDLWCEMRLTGRLVDPDSDAAAELRENLEDNRALLEPLLFRRHEVIGDLAPREAAIADAYMRGNQSVADALRGAARARALRSSPRKILPFFIVFHWNRIGLSIDEQVAFSFFMFELLDPKRGRGRRP
jgi:thiopeptide-type bacteriocin biosynthesis protein